MSQSQPDPGRRDVDPEYAGRAEVAFVAGLRAVATSASGAAARSGQVRVKLQQSLGEPLATEMRGRVHAVVVAAEEHVPATLSALAPVTEASLRRVASDLAARRGWTYETAARATTDWATALGLSDVQPTSLEPPPPAAPSADGAMSPSPATAQTKAPAPQEAAPRSTTPAWPEPGRQTRRALSRVALPANTGRLEAAASAYAGMSLQVFSSLIAVLLILGVGLVLLASRAGVAPSSGSGLLFAGAAAILAGRLKRGLLLVTSDGLIFMPFDRRMLTPRPDGALRSAWQKVEVLSSGSGGRLSTGRLRMDGHVLQVGPEGCRLLRAFAATPSTPGGRR